METLKLLPNTRYIICGSNHYLTETRYRDKASNSVSLKKLLPKDMGPLDICGNPTRFLRILYHQDHYKLSLKGMKTTQNERF